MQSEATQKLFKECLDYCCDVMKDPRAIQCRGYCYYCGTKIYPNDWFKAREAFEEYYQMTGDASAANTLGYIYYYGRCTGGVPEYDKAFMYFSVGHAYSYFESTYKLADMLANGYGVVKDEESANHLYRSVYKKNLKRFIKGDDCKFADTALRMGNVYRNGIGVEADPEMAYFYYIQADYAIRKRMDDNQYGDNVVFKRIQKALEETRKEYCDKGRTVKFIAPGWTDWTLIKHRRCRLTIKELNNGVLALDATPLKRRDEEVGPQMLITVPRADYCELRKNIRIKTAPETKYEIFNGELEIVFDSVEYDWSEKKTSFYLYDDLVGKIWTEYYSLTVAGKK
ncbi:MAG: sel1 repeat family protein [Oribacterium sp.]|nr:sel1 repeat family protein [Oribacterium sp.]